MAAAAQQAAMAAALQGHNRLHRSTEMLLFYRRKDKDTISARLFINRIETASRVANWDDARKLSEIYLVLRDRAVLWWSSLLDADVDRANYAAVKADFLASYEPCYTSKTTCTNFQELVQRQGEAVHDYYLRIHDSFAKMCLRCPCRRPDDNENRRYQGYRKVSQTSTFLSRPQQNALHQGNGG